MTTHNTFPISWRDEFATGIDEVDEQHRILVDILREADERLRADASLAALEKITRDLLGYALYHFDTEERLMREYGYSEHAAEDAARHLEEHRAFSAKVVAIRDDLKAGIPIAREALLSFLSDWLTQHILHTDQRLGAFISARRAA